ncbi:MAG: hypothetical protein RR911_01820 [Oscillospiraceae bacterium]
MMKYSKKIKFILSGIMCVALMISLCLTAFAKTTSEITFGKNFVFNPGTSDLFSNYKNLLPGESRSQQIKINNSSSDPVKFYLKFSSAQQDKNLTQAEKDLVMDLINNKIKITVKDLNGKEVYSGNLGGTNNLTQTTGGKTAETFFLGDLSAKTSKSFTAELEMDSSVGNEYQGLSGNVTWIFTAEQNGKSEDIIINDSNPPLAGLPNGGNGTIGGSGLINTGDPNSIVMWSVMLVGAVGTFVFIELKRRKSKNAS